MMMKIDIFLTIIFLIIIVLVGYVIVVLVTSKPPTPIPTPTPSPTLTPTPTPTPTPTLKPAEFRISDLKIVSEAFIDEPVQISVVVTNIGQVKGNYTVSLRINNEIIEKKEVIAVGKNSRSVIFTYTPKESGTFNVNVNNLKTSFRTFEIIDSFRLSQEYDDNEVAADLKYKDQIIYVEGSIKNIGTELLGRPYLMLDDGTFFGIQCIFPKGDASIIAGLKKGQEVLVKGKCDGKLILIIIKDCSIVNQNK